MLYLGNRGHRRPRRQGNGREHLNARVPWAEFFANIEEGNIVISH